MKGIIVGLIAIIVLAVGFVAFSDSDDTTDTASTPNTSTSTTQREATQVDTQSQAPVDNDGGGQLLAFSEATLADAQASGDDTVIFFHASWCPTCRELAKNLEAEGVPSGIRVLQADFDRDTQWRQRYGVTIQHTLVQVDADGEQLVKWTGGFTPESIAQQVI